MPTQRRRFSTLHMIYVSTPEDKQEYKKGRGNREKVK